MLGVRELNVAEDQLDQRQVYLLLAFEQRLQLALTELELNSLKSQLQNLDFLPEFDWVVFVNLVSEVEVD